MKLGQQLRIKQNQSLIMTPQLQQAIKLLQLSNVELAEFIETGIIEVAPLAFMRGRTLDKAYCIMDEAQNATEGQLRMFLTRMGKSAKFIITGDATQIDLPKKQASGLLNSIKVLENIKGISFVKLDGKDVIRHKLVKKIIEAYEKEDN